MNESTHESSKRTMEQKETPALLHSIDEYVIRVGMSRLYDCLSNLSAHQFPNLIVFPESSARPLAYGVKAIVEHLCRTRHLPIPAFRFILTMQESEKVIETRGGSLRLRADELMKESSAKNIFIVDDTLHTGFTVKTLYHAFRRENSPNLSYLAFYDTECLDPSENELEQSAYETIVEGGVSRDEIHAYFGFKEAREEEILDAEFSDQLIEPPTGFEKDLIKYGGFTYRSPKRHKLLFEKTMVTGVTKSSTDRISKPADDADLDLMRQLREEILTIANRTIEEKQKNLH